MRSIVLAAGTHAHALAASVPAVHAIAGTVNPRRTFGELSMSFHNDSSRTWFTLGEGSRFRLRL